MDLADPDIWDALRERGHTLGPAHVDDDGVLWVVVDGAPTRLETAKRLLLTPAVTGDRADATAREAQEEAFDIEAHGPRTLG